MRWTLPLLAALSLAACAALADPPAKEDGPPAVNPGRPTITDPAALTAPGWLETEMGIQKDLDRDRVFGSPVLLKLTAPGGRLQYRLAADGYIDAADAHQSGFGDTYAALQYLAAPQSRAGFDTSVRFQVKIPTAASTLGTRRFDFSGLLLASRDFCPTLHGDFNAGLASLTRMGAPGTDTQVFLSASFTMPIAHSRWQYTNELTYSSPLAGVPAAVTTMHGFSYTAKRYDVWDAAVQWQLHGAGANWQVLFGRTFMLTKLL